MKKDAYYFPHFSNARNDSKLIKLRRVLGIEGYGIYFMLLEILREQTEFRLPISGIEDLAYEWHTSREKIISVINDFGLFEIIDNEFFSSKLILYLQPYIEKSERARVAARTRWDAVKSNANAYANALPEHSPSNASKGKESKREESKVNKDEDIKEVYDLYPTRCPIQNRSTSKGKKDKEKIKSMLKDISKDDLISIINKYISDCKQHKTYIKNFSSFLNNLPDYETPKHSKGYTYLTDEEKAREQVPKHWTYIHYKDTYKKVHSNEQGEYIEDNLKKIYL